MADDLESLTLAVVDGDLDGARRAASSLIAAGTAAETVLRTGLMPGMTEVGRRFEEGEYFVPEMLLAARAMQGVLDLLAPSLTAADVQPVGTVLAGTVQGDVHDIGKNLVCIMLRGSGFRVRDLGVDVAPDAFVDAVAAGGVDVVALSALLTTTMPAMRRTIDALRDAGLRDRVKVIVGGAPLSAAFAREIGADGYAEDASRGAALARSLLT